MRHKFLISLISIVVVLVTYSFAYGESAWILWKHYNQICCPSYESWDIVEAFPDHEQCMLGKKKLWERSYDAWCYLFLLEPDGKKEMSIMRKLREEVRKRGLPLNEEETRVEIKGDPYEGILLIFLSSKGIPQKESVTLTINVEFKCLPDTVNPRK